MRILRCLAAIRPRSDLISCSSSSSLVPPSALAATSSLVAVSCIIILVYYSKKWYRPFTGFLQNMFAWKESICNIQNSRFLRFYQFYFETKKSSFRNRYKLNRKLLQEIPLIILFNVTTSKMLIIIRIF